MEQFVKEMLLKLNSIRTLLRKDSQYVLFRRCCSTHQNEESSNQTVRVRFAPSPTGKDEIEL